VGTAEALRGRTGDGTADDALAEQILDAAVEQFLHFGIRRVTVDDVARRAGVARITVYRRFASRDELVRRALLREARRVFDEVDAAVAGLPAAGERLVEGFVAILHGARRHPLACRLLATEPELVLPALTLEGGELVAAARDHLAAHLRDAQRRGELRRFDPTPVAELMVRLTVSFLLTPQSCIPLDTDEDARAFVRTYLLPVMLRNARR